MFNVKGCIYTIALFLLFFPLGMRGTPAEENLDSFVKAKFVSLPLYLVFKEKVRSND